MARTRTISALLQRALLGLALAAPFAALPAPAFAENGKADGQKVGKVEVTVHVIKATEAHKKVDAKLSSLTRFLKPLRYTGYELLSTHEVPVSGRAPGNFGIAGDRKVHIELLSRDEQNARLRVQIMGPKGQKLLDSTVSVRRNGTFIVAGPKYGDGVLVLPLTARY